ncbi:hypothetical protein AWC38_SpisGene3422 [Stylophora pistillata]|uniref:Uncharacterized protein n=1 Tax=Stylophora pistillata TaxID=50429 RepID=A0A2B4SP97_STYPI|nr:hypothetical protein AWC38_SpisGene3422 [Stylophora pistillata]
MAARQKTCMICGLSDGHTLMDCPYRCEFCGVSVKNCECHDSSIVSSVLALETPEKEGTRTETSTSTPAPPQAAREKRKGSTDDWCGTSNKIGQKRPEKTVPEKKFKEAKNDLQAAMKQWKKIGRTQ